MAGPTRRRAALPLAVGLLLAVFALQGGAIARAQGVQAGMALAAQGAGVSCAGDTCTAVAGTPFIVAIRTDGPPAAGYIVVQTHLYFKGLVYHPGTVEEENTWPDNSLPVRSPAEPTGQEFSLAHGGLTSASPPFRVSTFQGDLVHVNMACPAGGGTFVLALSSFSEAEPLGSSYSLPDQTTVPATPKRETDLDMEGDTTAEHIGIADSLNMDCGPSTGNGSPQPTAAGTAGPGAATPGGTSLATTPAAAQWTATAQARPTANGSYGSVGKDNGGGIGAGVIAIIVVVALLVAGIAGFAGWRYVGGGRAT